MDHSRRVGRRQRFGHLRGDLGDSARRHGAALDNFAQYLAFHQFADNVGQPFLVAGVEDRDDAGMVECAGGAGFELEALPPPGVRGDLGRQDFQRHRSAEARIARPVNLAHPAGAEKGEDFIMGDPFA